MMVLIATLVLAADVIANLLFQNNVQVAEAMCVVMLSIHMLEKK